MNFGILLSTLLIAVSITACNKSSAPNREDLEPPVLKVSVKTDSIFFSWNKVPVADQYQVICKNAKVKVNYVQSATNLSDTTAFAFSRDFYPMTKYQAWVIAFNTTTQHMSPQDQVVEFTSPCRPLTYFGIDGITSSKSQLTWKGGFANDYSDIKSFSLYLRKKNTTDFETFVTNEHSYLFEGLSPATDYEVKISFVCTDGKDYATPWKSFRTL